MYRKLNPIDVWICGYSWHRGLEKAQKIPGQKFSEEDTDYRYVKNVKYLKNSDKDWNKLVSRL
jgi:hypothetical protein|tara:strand:+ start:67 stop:255 length:189 start_codon:yes stop_codon:yes gene_type:complete